MALNFQNNEPLRISRILLVVFIAASVALITVYAREGSTGTLHQVQNAFHSIFAPVEYVGELGGAAVDNAGAAVSDATASEETLSQLRERIAELTELVTQGEEYRLEVERLQGLLNLKETYKIDGVSGRVIGRSTDAWNQTITIDVGSGSGVEVGLTVVGPSGVIGQVVEANPGSSTVRLLTDPKSGCAAMVQSVRADGIVRGSLAGLLYLENIDADIALSVGDVVLTSGLGGSYTKGLLIGTIVRIDGNAKDGTRSVIVSPNDQAAALEEVMVVFSASSASDTSAGASAATLPGSDAATVANEGGNTGESAGGTSAGAQGAQGNDPSVSVPTSGDDG